MSSSFVFNEVLSFKITSAQIWYGNSLTDFGFRGSGADPPEEARPTLCLNLMCQDYELRRLLGKGLAIAYIHRHPTDRVTFKDGIIAKGHLTVGVSNEDENERYIEIAGILPEYSFDAVASALTFNSNEMLTRSYLVVGLNQPRSQINFGTGDGPLNDNFIFVELLGIHFDIGEPA
jgi:hypothetical protein